MVVSWSIYLKIRGILHSIMQEVFDIIVIGLGANGSSALYNLSRTNKKVLGIDRHTPPHSYGSSHGESRIIRQAYHENPIYVPLVKAAYTLWEEIERDAGATLFQKTGGIMLGREDSSVVSGARLSAETHHIAYEFLHAATIQRRFPAFRPSPDTVGILEKEAGILFPEECIKAFLARAAANKADIQYNETVLGITPKNDKVEVATSKGRYIAEKVIIAAGAWTSELLPALQLPLSVERQVLYWFKDGNMPAPSHFLPENMPIYIWEYLPGKLFYGFPDLGNGIKTAHHHAGRSIRPDEMLQDAAKEEISEMEGIANKYLNMVPIFTTSSVCMYTNTPDENFIIDFHPAFKNIIIASPCSGHGFKFSSLTGKLLSDMAMDNKIDFDLAPFSITRPSIGTSTGSPGH
jgi:sarcosine oxidase